MVASKYNLCDTENNTQSKLCSMFKYSRNGNGMVYGPNEIYPYNLKLLLKKHGFMKDSFWNW